MASSRAVVTGASGGLGLEFAKLLAAAGYDLVLVARSESKLQEAANDLGSQFNINAQIVTLDLAQPNAGYALFEHIPSCDILINNAGFANFGRFANLLESNLLEEIRLNVETVAALTRLYLPGMIARNSGKILNVASTAAFVPGPTAAVYYATKAYVLSFSEAVSYELRNTGVTLTCLCPGATSTGFEKRAGRESTLLFRLPVGDAPSVAKAGFDAMMQGKPLVIPGFFNKLVAFSPKISPRRLLLAISERLLAP